ncbi:ACT domain-containing protein [Leuconostoc carnosum]|uniref:ACT domain-containing protein n=1 Tax=Leuconostoc TaxID=1243 RepID=UPI000D51309F|nr:MULTISPECIES: ACT domain-containing protein [Leuconostoc]KAA8324447.1 ACT domain-containing protein [Leuconostoc carnosum]KAA8358119.1 ACT domain-containing protein [Leuconostoc carnosum]KAA8364617.1 ACT domain-containing protein [Leuconostoc carnosum]MDV8936576.1 ACT domain-containing protein [Leuconostoc sp.]SPO33845.1 Acetolactate synthase small subunit [Leuconostoc carnosum]
MTTHTLFTRVYNHTGFLVRFASVLTRLNVNIKSFTVISNDDEIATVSFTFESEDNNQVANVRRNLKKQLDILSVGYVK